MTPFVRMSGIAAPLRMINVDTDQIIPKQFLKTVERSGLGRNLFDEMRFGEDGEEISDFVLNRSPWRSAEILVAGENFGCGSSREHAPWALLDFGIRCVIAPSFADIFYGNCFQNGMLPARLSSGEVERLWDYAESAANPTLDVDLPAQTIRIPEGDVFGFDIEPSRKTSLLEGLDVIALTLRRSAEIDSYESDESRCPPWIVGSDS